MRPSLMSHAATSSAVLLAIAKQIPCAGKMTAVFTPMTSPCEFTSGPPELPGFSAASVWMMLSMRRPDCARTERPSALTTPAVTVCWNPYGLPMATAISRHRQGIPVEQFIVIDGRLGRCLILRRIEAVAESANDFSRLPILRCIEYFHVLVMV